MLGSAARNEITLPAPLTLAILYDDTVAAYKPEHAAYFKGLATKTQAIVDTSGIPSGSAISSAPISEWKQMYSNLILDPLGHDIYSCRERFDLKPLSGNGSLVAQLQAGIQYHLEQNAVAIPLLANDTLANLPPLTFFRGLVLDWDGEQHEDVDIVKTAIAPIADAARVFAMAKGRLSPADTIDRLKSAEQDFPGAAAIFSDAGSAFRVALYYPGPRR